MFWSREKKKEDDENKENYRENLDASPPGSDKRGAKNVDVSSWDLQKFLDTEIDIMGYKLSYGLLIMGFLALVSIIGFVMVYIEPQEEMEYIEMAAPVASFAPAVPSFAPAVPSFAPPAMVPSPFVPPPMMMAPARPKKRSGKKKSGKKSAKKSAKKKSAKRR